MTVKNNRNRYPIVSDFGCSTGKFAEPDITSFSELFTVSEEGQALAYIGNASLGFFLSTAILIPKLFYKRFLQIVFTMLVKLLKLQNLKCYKILDLLSL
ncbi:MAG: hypothetical protein H6613_02010 [Ignavibacteriales bacterium]|nr:hypothetical protein [Ignavibacteriales bacterium]